MVIHIIYNKTVLRWFSHSLERVLGRPEVGLLSAAPLFSKFGPYLDTKTQPYESHDMSPGPGTCSRNNVSQRPA